MDQNLLFFIDLCDQKWPKKRVSITISRSFPQGTHFIKVQINEWLCPIEFTSGQLSDCHAVIREIERAVPLGVM